MYIIDVPYSTFFIVMVPLFRTSRIFQGPLYASWPNLVERLFLTSTVSLTLYSCLILLLFSAWLFLWIAACFRCLINCQLASNVKFMIASRPNTSCIGVACMVVWTVDRIAKITADRIPFHGSSSSSWDLFTWNVRRILLIVWWACSSMELACGLRLVIGLRVIP